MAFRTALWSVLLVAALLSMAAASAAIADPRPFGVLPEGVLEITKKASFDSGVELATGRVVVSGDFNRVAREPQYELALFEPDGTIVAGFAPRCAASADPGAEARSCRGQVLALPNGGFLLGGDFGAVDGVAARGVARFDGDGVRIARFDPLADTPGSVAAMALINEWIYVAVHDGSNGVLLRFGLARPGSLDTTFTHPGQVSSIVADNQGQIFVLVDQTVVRLQTESDDIDPDWSSGVDEAVHTLYHDANTDRLFVLSRQPSSTVSTVRRLDPGSSVGLEPQWTIGTDPAHPGVVFAEQALEAAGNGQVIIRGRLIGQPGLVGDIRGQRAVAASDGSVLVWLPEEQAVWPLAPRWPSGWLVALPELGHVDATLQPIEGFESRVRRTGGVNDVALAPNGRVVLVGTMTEIDGLARTGLARLDADFSLELGWPAVDIPPASPCQFGFSCTRARVAVHPSGAVVALDHPLGAPAIFLLSPRPRALILDESGSILRQRGSNEGEIVVAPDGRVYLTPPNSTCRTPFDHRIARTSIDDLLSTTSCLIDAGWALTAEDSYSLRSAPVISPDDGYLYFATIVNGEMDHNDWQIRRMATSPGATPDPDFVIDVRSALASDAGFSLALDGDHLYIANAIISINSASWAGPARVSRATGQLDTTWQPGVDRRVLRMDVGHGWAYLIRSASDSEWYTDPYFLEIVRIPTSGADVAEQVLATDGEFGDRFWKDTRTARILVLDQDRAIVAGHFSEIDGVPRDGFAVVGSVEAIFADGFEVD